MKPLLELVPDAKYPLRLVEADLCKPETWPNAVRRCTYVLHVASSVVLVATDEATIVRTAVQGVTNVLQACAEAGDVKCVVMTGSVVAMSSGTRGNPANPLDYVYTEKDWAVEEISTGYAKSKLKAEQAAWDFVKQLDESSLSSQLSIHLTFKVPYSVLVVERFLRSSAFAYSTVPFQLCQISLSILLMFVM